MRFRIAPAVFLATSIFAIMGGMFLAPSVAAAFRYLQEGMKAPSIRGVDLSTGGKISSDEYLKDNIVVITFWATWSQRSINQLADLKTLADRYQDRPIKIIAINVESQSIHPTMKKKIERIIAELDLPFAVIIDQGLEIFYQFGVIAVPSTAIMDTSGSLRYAPSGYSLTTRDFIIDSIEVLLGLREASPESVVVKGYIPKSKSSRYYHLALQLSNQRMYERALSNLDLSQEADSNFSAPLNLRGQIFIEIDSLPAATQEFEKAVTLDSSSVAARAGWGRALLRSGQIDSALEKLSEALSLDSSYTPAVLDMALCLARLQRTDEALEFLLKARDLNPQDPEIHYYIGRVYSEAGQIIKAADSFRRALDAIFPPP